MDSVYTNDIKRLLLFVSIAEQSQEAKRKLLFNASDDSLKDPTEQDQQKTSYSNAYSMPFPQLLFYPQTCINNCSNLMNASSSWSLGESSTLPSACSISANSPAISNGQQPKHETEETTPVSSPTSADNLEDKKTALTSPLAKSKVKSESELHKAAEFTAATTNTRMSPQTSPTDPHKSTNAKLNLSPLAIFCASLFQPNGGKSVANCE